MRVPEQKKSARRGPTVAFLPTDALPLRSAGAGVVGVEVQLVVVGVRGFELVAPDWRVGFRRGARRSDRGVAGRFALLARARRGGYIQI